MGESQEITVLVRDRERMMQFVAVDDTEAAVVMAAASSDPRCWRELGYAWLRYFPDRPLEQLAWVPYEGKCPAGRWLLVDLACQRLVCNDADFVPESVGAYQWNQDGQAPLLEAVWFNLPPWWKSVCSGQFLDGMNPLPAITEPLDFRGILFGRTMAAALAEEMLRLAQSEGLPAVVAMPNKAAWKTIPAGKQREIRDRWHGLTVKVHAHWLMTPREELEGQNPRHFLHQGREWVDREIQHRLSEWSILKRRPRPLDRDTVAYRHGPMALDEVVIYFDLCRTMIAAGWDLLCEQNLSSEKLGRAIFAIGQQWLEQGQIDGEPTPPATIIETSRRHMPQLSDGMPLDCDCPICQEMANNPQMGPTFVGFDGHHLELDGEFAFSLYESREEWQEMQEELHVFDEESRDPNEAPKCDNTMSQTTELEEDELEDDELEDAELGEEQDDEDDELEDWVRPKSSWTWPNES